MRLYNSLTDRSEPFEPASDPVTLYVCGITPYDTTHLGHAFTASVADVLVRYLEYQGRRVRYVQNVTDVDDDILRVAGETGENWLALGNRWTRHYIEDMVALHIRPPDCYARATDVIPQIIDGVQELLAAGVAYEAGGGVYFDIDAWDRFGSLSGLTREAMLPVANQRGNNPDDSHKRDPLDFVLWQAASPGEPAWESPWGPGRPGWHMECTTLIRQHLGSSIDLHAGGVDLIFPHHECEIAQAEPVGEAPFVRHWMHIAMVEHEGKKMSKSLGNLVMVRDLLERWSADAVRLYLASQHYRNPWSLAEEELERAQENADRISTAVGSFRHPAEEAEPGRRSVSIGGEAPASTGAMGDWNAMEDWTREGSEALLAFERAMSADLDTPRAVDALLRLAEQIDRSGEDAAEDRAALGRMARVFGLQMGESEPAVKRGWDEHLSRFQEH